MSGPKVVRIVTPQERELIKNRWLLRLSQAISEISAYAKENNLLDGDLEKGLVDTLDFYANLSADDYLKIEREVPEHIQFFKKERHKLKAKVANRKITKWEEFRKLKSTHNSLVAMLTERGIHFENFEFPNIITTKHLKEYQIQIDGLYNLILDASEPKHTLTQEQIDLQNRLSQGEHLLSVSAWKSQLPATKTRLEKLEMQLQQMFVNDVSQDKIQDLIARCEQLDPSIDNYDLQLDSLILDAAAFSNDEIALREARKKLIENLELAASLGTNPDLINKWEENLDSNDLKVILDTTQKALLFYEQVSETHIANARRNAIREALQKAGYKVNETMETAWVEDGKLVVKKTTNSLYGVEFMNPKNLSRIQARVVADEGRSNERSPSLDKNQEEIWCDDFSQLKALLESEDLEIIIDKMKEPGTVSIKEVPLKSGYDSQAIQKRRTKKL